MAHTAHMTHPTNATETEATYANATETEATHANATETQTETTMAYGSDEIAIADGGIETALVDRLGVELPEFAAFVLLNTEEGRAALAEYYRPFAELAAARDLPLVLDTPTWRANPDWGALLGYDIDALSRINAEAVSLTRSVAQRYAAEAQVTIGGCVGPRFDDEAPQEAQLDAEHSAGTIPAATTSTMTADEAEAYHLPQVRALVSAGVDRITAVTMTSTAEAEGIVRAALQCAAPVVVSFSVGANGRVAGDLTLAAAIERVDTATNGYAVGYLVNCAHPSEAKLALSSAVAKTTKPYTVTEQQTAENQTTASKAAEQTIRERVIGFRLNAATSDSATSNSAKSEGETKDGVANGEEINNDAMGDKAMSNHTTNVVGDSPTEFAAASLELRQWAPRASVFGGCCGTDIEHIEALADLLD